MTKSVFDIYEYDKEKDSIAFEFDIFLLELLDLRLREGLVEKVFERVDIFFMCIVGTDLVLSGSSDKLWPDVEFDGLGMWLGLGCEFLLWLFVIFMW